MVFVEIYKLYVAIITIIYPHLMNPILFLVMMGKAKYIFCLRNDLKFKRILSDMTTRQNYVYTYLVYIYIYILPYPRRVEFSGEWSNRVAISVYCKPLHIWIELSVAIERMYVNNSNCDS